MQAATRATVIEEPFGSKILTLDSPDFSVAYPFIHRKEMMPADLVALLDLAWTKGRFEGRKIDVYRLRDVFVAFEGLVFDKYLDVYRTSVTGHQPDEIESACHAIRDGMQNGSIPVNLSTAVLCKKRGTYNYGHFLIEMFPKAFLAMKHLPSDRLHYVVGAEDGALGDVIATSLAMLGIPQKRVVRCGREPAFFREIILIDGLTHHGQFMSPAICEGLDHLAAQVEAEPSERIYVSRRTADYRKMRNEDEVTAILAERGYRIVDPGGLSFREQIAVFKGARAIIGVTGAGLTNVAFSQPGATVTCLTPATMPETFYWLLATLRRHRFRDVRCEELGGQPPGFPSSSGDIRIDPDELRHWLDA